MSSHQGRLQGLRPVFRTLSPWQDRFFAKQGALGRIRRFWSEIVTPEIAAFCYPRKIRLAKRGSEQEGVVTLSVAHGCSLEVEYRSAQIQERINTFLGYRGVDRITQQSGNFWARTKEAPEASPLSPEQEAKVESRLQEILPPGTSKELYEALQSLGKSLAITPPASTPPDSEWES